MRHHRTRRYARLSPWVVTVTVATAGCVQPPSLPDLEAPCGVAISLPCSTSTPDAAALDAESESEPKPDELGPLTSDGAAGTSDAGADTEEADEGTAQNAPADAEIDDAGVIELDGALDAPLDAEPDLQLDAELDGEVDDEPDLVIDAEPDLVVDAELDPPLDAETDPPLDAETDPQVDAETDLEVDAAEDQPPPPDLLEIDPPEEAPLGAVVTLRLAGLTGAVAQYSAAFVAPAGELPLDHAPDSALDALRFDLRDPDPVFDTLPVEGTLVLTGPHYVVEMDYRISADMQPDVVAVVGAEDGDDILHLGRPTEITIDPYVRPASVHLALLRFDGQVLQEQPAIELASDSVAGVLTVRLPALPWPEGAPPRIPGRITFNFGPRFAEVRTPVEVMQ